MISIRFLSIIYYNAYLFSVEIFLGEDDIISKRNEITYTPWQFKDSTLNSKKTTKSNKEKQ